MALFDRLIENAVNFRVPGDSIEVDVRSDGDDLVISVSDAGVGIPEQDLAHVFDIFHTGSTAGDRAGNGLGLAIVEARCGTIDATSQVGVGMCFTLPLKARFVAGTGPARFQAPARHRQDEDTAVRLHLAAQRT